MLWATVFNSTPLVNGIIQETEYQLITDYNKLIIGLKQEAYADKPAQLIWRSVKVNKHGTIWYVRYGFLLVFYGNFVRKTPCTVLRYSDIRLPQPWNSG